MDESDVGVPCHCIVFQSIHHGFPQFRNEIIFIGQSLILTLTQVWSTVSRSTLQPHQEYHSLTPSENTVCVCGGVHEGACVCVIAHYGIKE